MLESNILQTHAPSRTLTKILEINILMWQTGRLMNPLDVANVVLTRLERSEELLSEYLPHQGGSSRRCSYAIRRPITSPHPTTGSRTESTDRTRMSGYNRAKMESISRISSLLESGKPDPVSSSTSGANIDQYHVLQLENSLSMPPRQPGAAPGASRGPSIATRSGGSSTVAMNARFLTGCGESSR
jgi:hypothetical protein